MTRSPSLGLRIEEGKKRTVLMKRGEVKKISHFRMLSVEKVEGKTNSSERRFVWVEERHR